MPFTRNNSSPCRVEQHRQPDTEPRPIDRLVEAERQSADIVGVAMMIAGRIAMAIGRLPALQTVASAESSASASRSSSAPRQSGAPG